MHELFTQSFWKGHPLGKPILGTTETVGRLGQQHFFAYHGDRFHGGNMIFSAAGNLDHDQFTAAVAEKFSAARRRRAVAGAFRARAERPHYSAQQKSAGAGADLPGRARAAHHRRKSLRHADSEHGARRRHEFAALSDHSRGARPGLFDLLRPEPLSRHGKSLRLCGHFGKQGAGGRGSDPGRIPQSEGDSRSATRN